MTFQQEFSSWFSPLKSASQEPPKIGAHAPQSKQLDIEQGRPAVVVFLRHCGCPFAEKTFLRLRESAQRHHDINFYALSHSDEAATQHWLKALPQAGSEPSNLHVIVDDDREAYSAWGLGASSWTHFLSPSALYEVYRLGKEEGIWNRPTESGSRWQQSGYWSVDSKGVIKWGRVAENAGDVPDFENAVSAAS